MRDGKIWNSAIVIGRDGDIVGIYDKVHPVTSTPDYTEFEGGAETLGYSFLYLSIPLRAVNAYKCPRKSSFWSGDELDDLGEGDS